MPFFQQPPRLPQPYAADAALREHLERLLPPDALADVEPRLAALGDAAAGPLAELGDRAEAEPPRLVPYDPWGRRVDRIETSAAWDALHVEQARLGLAALPYEGRYGEHARVVQHAFAHLYGPSSATYTCPVSMTDGAVRVLLDHADPPLRDRIVPRLTARTADAWTSGQWMTEREGGSDVGRTATVARPLGDGGWALHGTKWFTSATTADCALALARPEGAGGGSGALALFLVERVHPRTGESQLGRTILVNRLKDKLGTRSLPTAELTLAGAYATPVGAPERGLKKIVGMLAVTRAWNAMQSAAGMRRAVQLAVAYARVREAFGRPLLDLPLHRETLADLVVRTDGAYALTARVLQLMGRVEQGVAGNDEARVLRGLLPLTKLSTAKEAVAVASEALEAFGGAGYIEDTGIPVLLRNAQVLPIWEGTTNVLSLDLLRAELREQAVSAVLADADERLEGAETPELGDAVRMVSGAAAALAQQRRRWDGLDADEVERGMRAFALRLARCYTAALLCEHAAYRIAKHGDRRAAEVAERYVGVELARRDDLGGDDERPPASAALLGVE